MALVFNYMNGKYVGNIRVAKKEGFQVTLSTERPMTIIGFDMLSKLVPDDIEREGIVAEAQKFTAVCINGRKNLHPIALSNIIVSGCPVNTFECLVDLSCSDLNVIGTDIISACEVMNCEASKWLVFDNLNEEMYHQNFSEMYKSLIGKEISKAVNGLSSALKESGYTDSMSTLGSLKGLQD